MTYVTCVVSAFVPIVNAEAYLLGLTLTSEGPSVWLLALAAALGQMTGKLVFYYIGRGALTLPRLARKGRDAGRWQRRLDAWRDKAARRPVWALGMVGLSAFVGLPPFAVVSVLAGTLPLHVVRFALVGLVGRYGRFALLLALPGVASKIFG